jgi:hypothetical protein
MKPRFSLTPVALGIFAVLALAAYFTALNRIEAAASVDPSKGISIVYRQGLLSFAIPVEASAKGGPGRLTVEILDPEDRAIGTIEQAATIREGAGMNVWRNEIRLASKLPVEDLVWHRLHYRFTYDDKKTPLIEGTASMSSALRQPLVRVLGQQKYASGEKAAVRVVATDNHGDVIAGSSLLRVSLEAADGNSRELFRGPLNARGTTETRLQFPAGALGQYTLRYAVDTPLGSAEVQQPVRLESETSVLLTTEKPLYQPGQTIHVRALALAKPNRQAAANRKLTFELEDSRGNKVFRKATVTDAFGVAAVEFPLADEVNLGTYHLRAFAADESAQYKVDPNAKVGGGTPPFLHGGGVVVKRCDGACLVLAADLAINVEKYVLPKFKVAIEFTGKQQHGYRPGDHVAGVVRSHYFFGKPVEGDVSVKILGMDVSGFEASKPAQGRTDADGAFRFDLKLPDFVAGSTLQQGAAQMLVQAEVTDSAAHRELRGEPVTVSRSPLLITAIPESGKLVPGIDNDIYILTSYADGKPAQTDLIVNSNKRVSTDSNGIAVVRLASSVLTQVEVKASDKEGNQATRRIDLETRNGTDQILLRASHAIAKAGDSLQFQVLSTRKSGAAYVDIVKDGQTILTRDLDLVDGRASFDITATPDLAGTVDVNAYLFGQDAIPVSDHRLVFVQPADELKIEAASNAPVYQPGSEAKVRFRVTNRKGQGVQAILGLQVVDEAVFALAEKQPGFAKIFFYLEQELLKPRYEIHSVGAEDLVTRADQRGAQALFAAAETVRKNSFVAETGRGVPMNRQFEYRNRYGARLAVRIREMGPAIRKQWVDSRGDLSRMTILDAWNRPLRFQQISWSTDRSLYQLTSDGGDGQRYTMDDLSLMVDMRTQRPDPSTLDGTMQASVEHDKGPSNGRASLAGTIKDTGGLTVEGATLNFRLLPGGTRRAVKSNSYGQFHVGALEPGEYEFTFGSKPEGKKILRLTARDQAIITIAVQRQVESFESIAVVDALNDTRRGMDRIFEMRGVVGGVPGGAAGGVIGGIIGGVPSAAPPPPTVFAMAGAIALSADRDKAKVVKEQDSGSSGVARVRSYFPEALYINPQIVTDHNGEASIVIPVADSITTWRMSMLASTRNGALGSGTSSLKVFQDFFSELDLPVTLTQGDRVSLPVAVYNYTGSSGEAKVQLQKDDWFSLVDDSSEKMLKSETGRVSGSQFTIEAKRIGKFKLTLTSKLQGRSDIVVREIDVIPNGAEQSQVFNGRLESFAAQNHEVVFPADAIPDASKVFVRLYPGPLSQVVEGMDAILRLPGGCFEQTSSSTYPNILALDYMKRTKKLTPEVRAKAEGFISNGYQRLLTFEVPGGGFSWFGQAPANKILTSYGLMEFSDMSKVHDVDARLISRTQQWLASQQQADGSWQPDQSFINEGATNRYNTDVLRISAYVAWSLSNTKYQGPAVERAKQYVQSHMGQKQLDVYTLAVIANFAADYAKDAEFTRRAVELLVNARAEKGELVWWNAEETSVYARGESAAVETTGLAVQALLRSGHESGTSKKALSYLVSKKDASGTWGTTQATIMTLRALLMATEKSASGETLGTIEVTWNGVPVQKLQLTADNNDLFHQFVLKRPDFAGTNRVGLRFEGKGSGLAYQIAGQYFLPWNTKAKPVEALAIDVTYDRTSLAQNDIAKATATVRNNMVHSANMVMIDLGIPPGFELLSEDLQEMQEKTAGRRGGGKLEKLTQTATQAMLYFDSIPAGGTLVVPYRLRAKYPIRAKTLLSRTWEYYDPSVRSVARPVVLEVRAPKR